MIEFKPESLGQTKLGLKCNEDPVGLALILLSSVLVGIWAVKSTIALRNILLGLEVLFSLRYCNQIFKLGNIKIPFKNWIPIILVALMFCWVVLHYFFLSRYPEIQLHELKSTWLRALLASIVGFGTGLALLKRPNAINFLWLGILISFGYLYFQYLPLAISTNNINYHGYDFFIYPGKISGVLAGTILAAGLLGTLLDLLPHIRGAVKSLMILFWLSCTCLVLFADVYIFDARNGIGLVVIIYSVVALAAICLTAKHLWASRDLVKASKVMILIVLMMTLIAGFAYQQFKINSGWSSMFLDVKTAVQIEKHPNWRDKWRFGYPQTDAGKIVTPNTYERVSWAVAGVIIFIPENPLGVGILSKPFSMLLNKKYPDSGKYIVSTHSAWVEIALAFGVPGLALTLGSLLGILGLSIRAKGPFRYTPAIHSFSMVLLYIVGEISSQHAIEILFFWIALLAATLFPRSSR